MWITPDRIVSDAKNFEWGNSLHRIWYVRDEETGIWYRAAGHRTAGKKVLAGERFGHAQAYVGDRKKQKLKLYTYEPGPPHQAWNVVSGDQVAMTLVEVRQAVDLKRMMADAYDKKGEMQFNAGDEAGAGESWGEAMDLRTEANGMYRDDV